MAKIQICRSKIGREEARQIQLAQTCQKYIFLLDMIECDSHRVNEWLSSNLGTLSVSLSFSQSHLHIKVLNKLNNISTVIMKIQVH